MTRSTSGEETIDYDRSTALGWTEDFHDLTVEELRELPPHLQLGMDLSILD